MFPNHKSLLAVLAIFSLFLAVSCVKEDKSTVPTIAAIAVTNADFSTLEGAAVQGGVAVVLSNPNPGDPSGDYTVFAPNNDAFSRLGLNTEADLAVLDR
jgi:Secreted and surface protein containing fasciclin-like repeats